MDLSPKQKLIRFLTPILLPVVRIYWKIFKPETFGVKVIIENEGKYLYVRNSYGYKRITFPGGRIDKGESPEDAAIREVKEEIGIDLVNLKSIGNYVSTAEGKQDNIRIFYGQSKTDELVVDRFEIEETGWFTKNKLPDFGPIAKNIWDLFISKNINI